MTSLHNLLQTDIPNDTRTWSKDLIERIRVVLVRRWIVEPQNTYTMTGVITNMMTTSSSTSKITRGSIEDDEWAKMFSSPVMVSTPHSDALHHTLVEKALLDIETEDGLTKEVWYPVNITTAQLDEAYHLTRRKSDISLSEKYDNTNRNPLLKVMARYGHDHVLTNEELEIIVSDLNI